MIAPEGGFPPSILILYSLVAYATSPLDFLRGPGDLLMKICILNTFVFTIFLSSPLCLAGTPAPCSAAITEAAITGQDFERIGQISSLTKPEIQDLLNKSAALVPALLQRIQARDFRTLRTILIPGLGAHADQDRAHAAAFLAKCMVNLHAARGVPWDIAEKVAGRTAWSVAWNAARSAAWDTVAQVAMTAAKDAAWGWTAKGTAVWLAVWQAESAWKDNTNAATIALRTLQLSPGETGNKAHRIVDLISLHLLLKDETHFANVFKAVYKALDGSMTIERAKTIIASHPNLLVPADNPYVHDLEAFLLELKLLDRKQ